MDRDPRNRRGPFAGQCNHFFRHGTCKFGERCKYSHETLSSPATSSRAPAPRRNRQEERGPAEDRLREWKRLLNQNPSTSRPTYSATGTNQQVYDRFFQLALELMEGDVGASQETVKLMAQDSGLGFIKNLIDRQIPEAAANSTKTRLWQNQIQPLFHILTHPRVVDSNVLEQQIAAIYNFIQGIGGRRMRTLFDFIMNLLHAWSSLPMVKEDQDGISACALSLSVLAKMIDCNTSNIVNDHFTQIVEQFGDYIQTAFDSPNEFAKLQAQKYLQYLQRRLGVGSSLAEAGTKKKAPVARAEFVMRTDLPGRLSADGPRHDNDHADICDIGILPTREEITSIRNEYLPTTDSSLFHRPGMQGRLDREFRLLREDTVGQLRNAVGAQLAAMRDPTRKKDRGNGTNAYEDAAVVDVNFTKHQGMQLLVEFRQPAPNKTTPKRRDWWATSKRLQPGGLVCILSGSGSVLFCVVGDNTVVVQEKKGNSKADGEEANSSRKLSLADDDAFAYVYLHLVEARPNDIGQALRWFRDIGPRQQQRCLVEFPRVLLASFQHTLIALQQMSKKADVPFDDLLAPAEQGVDSGLKVVGPPQYTTKPGFSFDLSCLANDNTTLRHSPREPLDPRVLARHSPLDPTQSRALLNTLSRRLALIQGPPGTGKSFTGEKVIKVLLANKDPASLGPILCVCYTNHALDQLLVHLKRDGVKLIRIGSRSKSEELEGLNLRVVAKNAVRTRAEKSSLWEQNSSRDKFIRSIETSIQHLEASQGLTALKNYLSQFHSQHYAALFGAEEVDEEGYKKVQHHKPGQLLGQWLNSSAGSTYAPRDINVLVHANIWTMSNFERVRLYTHWQGEIRDPLITDIVREYKSYNGAKSELDKVSRDVDLRCLHESEVIGVTTTGLAKNLDLLQKLRCKVMLCEEAGEVLEAHTLTALLPSVEHAILIGDHLQLRPQIVNYELQSTSFQGTQYSLDVSLFERLIRPPYDTDPRLPFDTLETQRRMHPSISELIRSTLYPALDDGGAVTQYPEVLGMKKRLFWLHHEASEDQETHPDPATTSHTNTFEIEMTISLVQHLVRQGSYGAEDIAVITPYLAQLGRLRREMGKLFEITVGERDLEDLEALDDKSAETILQAHRPTTIKKTLLNSIRLATVDNFQGEEAKVVVISLVRSNNANKCGFLSTSNRINVLLSRAQHGMYLIGNANTCRHVQMWAKVLEILEANGNIGTQLELSCPRHPNPDFPLLVSKADDFLRVAPEGGCILQCDRRLPCGHSCINRCHHENLHNAVKCLEPCPRTKRGCKHPCRLVCGEPCKPKCDELVQTINITLACGHTVSSAPCWQTQDPTSIICKKMVKKIVPGCDHTVEVPCNVDVSDDTYRCGNMCSDPQPCGHSCRSSCWQCKERRDGQIVKTNHGICKQACGRKYTTCHHVCRRLCHGEAECPLCSEPCEVRCSHSRCGKKCHEPCAPCAEQTCASCCAHSQCTMPCAAPCDWVPCSRRCDKILSCGHQCPSLCGEVCPDVKFCQICCSEDIKSAVVDFIMMSEYREIDLNEDPCIFPDCGHFTTKRNMDGIMDMKAHYAMSAEGDPVALSNATQPFSMDEVKVCPTCRGSLRNIARYGRIVRRAMLDEATKKFVAWSQTEYARLANALLDIQVQISKAPVNQSLPKQAGSGKKKFTSGRLKQIQLIHDWQRGVRYQEALKHWQRINTFIGQVRRDEQPFQRVDDFVQHAAQHRNTQGAFAFDETRIQKKGHLQALSLSLKCDIIVISDFMQLRHLPHETQDEPKLDFSQHMKECETLAERAKMTKYPRQEAEAHMYFAQFCAFSRTLTLAENPLLDEAQTARVSSLKEQGAKHIEAAFNLARNYPGQTRGMWDEIESAEAMLNDGVFYSTVSPDEMRAVYQAMASEFSGTGHWYTCENGHPFTVGECGMPMERASCPECGAAVGGTHHMPAQGVQRADDIDDLARGIDGMGIN
ncbi:hypothetical protein GGS26DRAFT_249873 [Hypomontagnella submonticulosa]|nr:hypothetical protein GGS26DRAFT_249873 [Hypomontagnella submonticulosa]